MFFYFSKRSFSQFKVCRKNLTTPHHGLLNTKLNKPSSLIVIVICVIVIRIIVIRIIVIRVIVIRIIVIVVVVFIIIIIINQLFTEVKVNIHHIWPTWRLFKHIPYRNWKNLVSVSQYTEKRSEIELLSYNWSILLFGGELHLLITSGLANQRAQKVLFTGAVYGNYIYWHHVESVYLPLLVFH